MQQRQRLVTPFVLKAASRIIAWCLLALIVFATSVPPVLRPITGVPNEFEHFIIFLMTSILFNFAYPRRELILCLIGILLSGALEVLQLFIPGRHARLSDFIVDVIAACVGVIAGSVWTR